MSMKLYDKDIACVMQNIKAYGECRRLDNNAHWKMNDKEKLVLRSDMAYELGGGMNEARVHWHLLRIKLLLIQTECIL